MNRARALTYAALGIAVLSGLLLPSPAQSFDDKRRGFAAELGLMAALSHTYDGSDWTEGKQEMRPVLGVRGRLGWGVSDHVLLNFLVCDYTIANEDYASHVDAEVVTGLFDIGTTVFLGGAAPAWSIEGVVGSGGSGDRENDEASGGFGYQLGIGREVGSHSLVTLSFGRFFSEDPFRTRTTIAISSTWFPY